jgi:hypothetical protein
VDENSRKGAGVPSVGELDANRVFFVRGACKTASWVYALYARIGTASTGVHGDAEILWAFYCEPCRRRDGRERRALNHRTL